MILMVFTKRGKPRRRCDMLGLVTSVFIFLGYWLIGGVATTSAFLTASTFLFWWYVVFAVVVGGFLLLLTLGIVGTGTVAGASEGGLFGALVGGVLSSGLGLLVWVMFSIRQVLLVGGAWLVSHAGTSSMSTFQEFNMTYLVVGGIMVLVGVIMSRSSSSSSENNN